MSGMSPAEMEEAFREHFEAEVAGDLERTMETMAGEPHVNHVPVMMGGTGREGVRRFYGRHLVGRFFPPDVEMVDVSRTYGENQLVDETVTTFTHTQPMDWMLPGVAPTGKRVEVAIVVVVGFREPVERLSSLVGWTAPTTDAGMAQISKRSNNEK